MDIKTAMRAARMSKAAYGFPAGSTIVKIRTAKALICDGDDCVWIALEGTQPKIIDWLKNFWTAQKDFHGLQVHSGCAREASQLLPMILACLDKYETKPKVRVTGHSQGGGVAALVAWVLASENYHILSGHGFAPMRSVEKKSCRIFNSIFSGRWFSIARQSDIIPHVPPAVRYGDTGQGFFLNEAGQLVRGIPSPWKYAMSLIRLACAGQIKEIWADHCIDKYVDDMEALYK